MKRPQDVPPTPGWRPPSRRRFLALLGTGAAALATHAVLPTPVPVVAVEEAPRAPRITNRWIGHC